MLFSNRFGFGAVVMASCLCMGVPLVRAQCEAGKVVPSDAVAGAEFARGVSISGDVAVFGAFKAPCADGANCGAAYVFRWDGTDWVEEQKLTPSDIQPGTFFGGSTGISGNVIVAGKPTGNSGLYVFRWNGTMWFQEAKLEAADNTFGQLGISTSIDGDVAVGGAPLDDEGGTWAGAAYVFRRVAGVWQQEVKLIASDAEAGDQFGISVSVDGDRIVVGSHRDDYACPGDPDCNSGAAYVFRFDGSAWIEEAKLTPPDAAAGDGLGFSTQISGDRVIAGASGDDPAGSAYVFRREGTAWVQEAKLTASDGQSGDTFGIVSIHGDKVLVGAPRDDDACPADPSCNSGAGYLFRRDGTTWTEIAKLTASDASAGDLLGWIESVAIGERFALLAASLKDDTGVDSGAGYAYIVGGDCNQNGTPDGCEQDTDGDGVIDDCDPCPLDPVDNDSDGDGVCVPDDQCPSDPNKTQPGQCGCGVSGEQDADGDTVADCHDQCPGEDDTIDANQNGTPDCLDPPAVPTIGSWGLAILAMTLLAAGKVYFGRREDVRHGHS